MRMFEIIPIITDYYGEVIQDTDGEYFMNYSKCEPVPDGLLVKTGTSKGYRTVAELFEEFQISDIDVFGLN